ncbi:MAG: hypothetical protein Kow00109_04320 [Acidobacteriota bacterium]
MRKEALPRALQGIVKEGPGGGWEFRVEDGKPLWCVAFVRSFPPATMRAGFKRIRETIRSLRLLLDELPEFELLGRRPDLREVGTAGEVLGSLEKGARWFQTMAAISWSCVRFLESRGLRVNRETGEVKVLVGNRAARQFLTDAVIYTHRKLGLKGYGLEAREAIARALAPYFAPEDIDPSRDGPIHRALRNWRDVLDAKVDLSALEPEPAAVAVDLDEYPPAEAERLLSELLAGAFEPSDEADSD